MSCIFCEIAQKNIRAQVVYENDEFIAFENISPNAPVHVLVIPKAHIEKVDSVAGKVPGLWDKLMLAVNEVIKKFELDKTGYKLILNGAGYNHIAHEHVHVLGGKNWKPKHEP